MSSFTTRQVSLQEAMTIHYEGDNTYRLKLPPSICFANVVFGGLLTSVAHKAARDLVACRIPNSLGNRCHVLGVYTQFFRPTLAHPQESRIAFHLTNTSKATTVLRFEITQSNKLCVTGYITLGDLEGFGQITIIETGWKLTPSTPTVSLRELEQDESTTWSGYLTPFDPSTYRKQQSYVRYFVPIQRSQVNYIDQWVEPAWHDENGQQPVWTDETIHFIIDGSLPVINDLLDTNNEFGTYQQVVAAGLDQKQARQEGRSDVIWGKGLSDAEFRVPWIISTISTTTDIKRSLPSTGHRWLYLRATIRSVINSKLDMEVVLMDPDMKLLAISQQMCQIIPVQGKRSKSANL